MTSQQQRTVLVLYCTRRLIALPQQLPYVHPIGPIYMSPKCFTRTILYLFHYFAGNRTNTLCPT